MIRRHPNRRGTSRLAYRPPPEGDGTRAADKGGVGQALPLDTPAMRLPEVARRLAISRAAAYRLVRNGRLRGIQVGKTWRVLRADFEAYVDEQRAEAERRYRHARGEG